MDVPWTNGFIEGCNNKTKVLKRVCFGMSNFDYFINRILFAAERSRNLGCQVTHAGIHPVARAALVRKPSVDGQHHLIGLRGVIQRFGFTG